MGKRLGDFIWDNDEAEEDEEEKACIDFNIAYTWIIVGEEPPE